MKPKVIKNETEYDAALECIDQLMDAEPGTPEFDELELWGMLVDAYEEEAHPVELPDPVEAILFRMDQSGFKQKDLAPLIGSASKVSEVMSGKRSLSLTMIRNLNRELRIPAEVLLQEPGAKLVDPLEGVDWNKFPLKEILDRKWIPDFEGSLRDAKERAEELLSAWAAPLGEGALEPALLRQYVRDGGKANGYALTAWKIRVSLSALEEELPDYKPGTITQDFMRDLVRLSYLDNGPALAEEYLQKNGIHLVVEPHLPRTHLDGAAIRLPNGAPLVALTTRYDRLDNFWFTLCHELAHIALHFDDDEFDVFFDDLDQHEVETLESDADHWASEALIPNALWAATDLCQKPTPKRVFDFAASLRINPVIPMGRIRRETGNYKLFGSFIAKQKVRQFWGLNSRRTIGARNRRPT